MRINMIRRRAIILAGKALAEATVRMHWDWLALPAQVEWHGQSVLGSLLGWNVFRDTIDP